MMTYSHNDIVSLMLKPISFGGIEDNTTDETDDFEWDNSFREGGFDAVMLGAATITGGAVVTQFDSPLPGPADVVGGAIIVVGVAELAIGTVIYGTGLIGGAIDQFTGP